MRKIILFLSTVKSFSYWLFLAICVLKAGSIWAGHPMSHFNFALPFLLLSLGNQLWHHAIAAPLEYLLFYNLGVSKWVFWAIAVLIHLALSILIAIW